MVAPFPAACLSHCPSPPKQRASTHTQRCEPAARQTRPSRPTTPGPATRYPATVALSPACRGSPPVGLHAAHTNVMQGLGRPRTRAHPSPLQEVALRLKEDGAGHRPEPSARYLRASAPREQERVAPATPEL